MEVKRVNTVLEELALEPFLTDSATSVHDHGNSPKVIIRENMIGGGRANVDRKLPRDIIKRGSMQEQRPWIQIKRESNFPREKGVPKGFR